MGTQMADVNSPGAPWSGSVVDIGEIGNDVELQQDLTHFVNGHDLQIDKQRQSEYLNLRTSLTQMNQPTHRDTEVKQRSSQRYGTQNRLSANHSLISSNIHNLT